MCSRLTVVVLCVGLWVQCCIIESKNIRRWRPRPCDWHLRAGPLQLSGGFILVCVWAKCDMFSWSLNRAEKSEKAPKITLCGFLWFLQTHSLFRVRPSLASVRRCVTTLRSFAFSIWKSWAWSVLAGCPGVASLIILNNSYLSCLLLLLSMHVDTYSTILMLSCFSQVLCWTSGFVFQDWQSYADIQIFNNIHTQTQCIPQKLNVQRMPAGLWPRPFRSFRVLKSHLQSQKISIIQKDSAYQKRSEGQYWNDLSKLTTVFNEVEKQIRKPQKGIVWECMRLNCTYCTFLQMSVTSRWPRFGSGRFSPSVWRLEKTRSLPGLNSACTRHCRDQTVTWDTWNTRDTWDMALHALLISFVQGLSCRMVLQGHAFGRSHPGIPLSVWPASPSTSPKVSNAKISLHDSLCLCWRRNCYVQHTCH